MLKTPDIKLVQFNVTNSRIDLNKLFSSSLQMPKPAMGRSSIVATVCAWLPHSSVTGTTIVVMAVTRRCALQPPPVPAARMSFDATTLSASQRCGAATGTPTAKINQTNPWSAAAARRNLRSPNAPPGSSNAGAENAFIWTGNATEMLTARTSQMRLTVVSIQECIWSLLSISRVLPKVFMRRVQR